MKMKLRNGIGAGYDTTGANAVADRVFTDNAVPGDECIDGLAFG